MPDFTQVAVALATPRIFRGRTVRELQVIRANPFAAPAVEREFSRSDRILVRVEAYAPGGVVPVVTARLLNRGGGAMTDLLLEEVVGRIGDHVDDGIADAEHVEAGLGHGKSWL